MQKIDLTELQAQIDNRQLSASEQPTQRTEHQERIIETIWETLTDIYGSTLANQYGDVMPEAWIALLKGLSPIQMKAGLNKLATRESPFPPNGAEFRQLCLPETISPDGKNSSAYLSFDDPKHPEYAHYGKKKLESSGYVSKRKEAGRAALSGLRDMFPEAKPKDEELVVDADGSLVVKGDGEE